jgi:hypothetical protein
VIRMTAAILAILALPAFAACGGDDDDGGAEPSDVSESDVVRALDLESDPETGIGWETVDGYCEVQSIQLGEAEVGFFEQGGIQATNEDGTVGVETAAQSPNVSDAECVEQVEEDLAEAGF